MSESLPGYPIKIRYNDLDTYGHVNNAIYITYLEEGRTAWFQDKVGKNWEWNKQGTIIARHEINYKVPILFNDHVRILLWISDIGTKSFEVSYKIIKLQGEEWISCTSGKSVLVCFDYQKQKTIAIPEDWREIFLESRKEPSV